jgi:hypothetical protein
MPRNTPRPERKKKKMCYTENFIKDKSTKERKI